MAIAEDIFQHSAFSLSQTAKEDVLIPLLSLLHNLHLEKNPQYRKLSKNLFSRKTIQSENSAGLLQLSDLPFLPVSLFKSHLLQSIPQEDVFKILTSSGTTGQVPSRIVLDRETAQLQTRVLSHIFTEILGEERLPMLVVDSKKVIKDRKSFSARGAGILGMSVFGRKPVYALNDDFELDRDVVIEFAKQNAGRPVFIFGFTFMVWQFLVESGIKVDLSGARLIHSGGWKKLIDKQVDNQAFKSGLNDALGIQPNNIRNFYGMVEQVGSVFPEDENGYLHCPIFADVLIRDPRTLKILPDGEVGLIQVLSCLPQSYPGHSILTEDLGVVRGVDQGQWGGKSFEIIGRVPKAEVRGCSDTFE